MTDITELAQREKFEVWAHSQKLSLAYGDCGYAFSSTEMAWRAWMASSAELVAALEKAQQLETLAAEMAIQISKGLAEAYKRIAELESRTVKLPKLKMLEDYLAEVAIEERKQILVGVKLEFHRACVAAGIKVEAE